VEEHSILLSCFVGKEETHGVAICVTILLSQNAGSFNPRSEILIVNDPRFSLIREIGRTGFSIVDEVDSRTSSGVRLARKRLQDDARADPKQRARFRREVQILRQLKHPNIVPILDSGLQSDDPWFTMPLAEGNLAQEIVPGVGLTDDRIRSILGQLLDALEYAHARGVIHRDLSPRNVLFLNATVVVSDFGLGRELSAIDQLTSDGERGGTHGYTAPEQWSNLHEATEQSDIFGLGGLLFHMATGLRPMAMTSQTLPSKYGYVIRRCMHDDPEKRYQSIAALREDFDRLWLPNMDAAPASVLAETYLARAEVDHEQFGMLIELYQRHADDEALYRRTLPLWSNKLLGMLLRQDPDAFSEILTVFEKHVEGHLQFDYVDIVGNFLERVYRVSQDPEIRRLVLARLLIMGEHHNRFHSGRLFARLAASAQGSAEVLTIRSVLFDHPAAARWVAEFMQGKSIPKLISDAIANLRGESPMLALPANQSTAKLPSVASARSPHFSGQVVFHPKFGRGQVVEVKPRGSDHEVAVVFDRFGHKRLLASFAMLEVASDQEQSIPRKYLD
jgi:eukaryotic-like serine/threonine-protein kinase